MKLNANFSALRIEAAKMNGLEGLVNELRTQKVAFNQGLDIASAFTRECGGIVEDKGEGVVGLTLNGFSVDCFQPYSDIDLFYFEHQELSMKIPIYFAGLSELTIKSFKWRAVITPKRRFDIYDEGRYCNVINWSSEYKTHIYQRVSYSANVDGKPLYFVDTYGSITGDWLCSQSYRTIKEVKKAWHGQL